MRGPSTDHPDTDILAEFHAGLIGGHRAARIAGHLAGCEQCTELSAQLAEVSALLAAVPAPAMPPSVARRLDTVLAAEVEKRHYSERPDGASSPEPPTRRRQRPEGRGFRLVALRVLAPAAAVILAAAGYGLSRIGGGPSSQSSAGSAATGHVPASARASALTPRQANAKPELMSPHNFTVHISDTDYQRGTLRTQLATEMRTPSRTPSTRPPSGQVAACVYLVTNDVKPVYVESARFDGQPATIIVVSQRSGDEAWVAGAHCSGTDKDLLDMTTLPPGI